MYSHQHISVFPKLDDSSDNAEMDEPVTPLARSLTLLMSVKGLNPTSLAALVNEASGRDVTSQVNIWRLAKGQVKQPRDSSLTEIADFFGLSVHQLKDDDYVRAFIANGLQPPPGLLTGSAAPMSLSNVLPWEEINDLPKDLFIGVPELDVEAAGGHGRINGEWPTKQKEIAYRVDYLRGSKAKTNNLVHIIIKGDSMLPTLGHGDSALVDMGQNQIQNGLVYAFVRDHGVCVKRLYQVGGKLIIESDNKAQPEWKYPEELEGEDAAAICIIGRVVNRSGSGGL